MSDTDELISGALRDLAAQAVLVPPAADALWRAGQRRRRRGVLASSASAAAAIVLAVMLALTVGRGTTGAAGPVALRTPILFEQVSTIGSSPPCPAGASTMPRSSVPPVCFEMTGTGITIRRVESAQVRQAGPGGYQVDIRLAPADARLFAALTRELARGPSPRNQLAIIVGGRIYAHPVVKVAITSGQAEITGFPTRARAERLLRALLGH